ncbi:MAG: uroporphyrinogen-III synthase [Acidobacteria bacterium]|nr:uroporphyrinogen-III synthase [Acidobacteriota bacterium]
MATLIRNQGGVPIVAPSMREATLEQNEELYTFARRFFSGEFDMLILLTGVGFRAMRAKILERHSEAELMDALRRVKLVARGPKPTAALREIGLAPAIIAPEPNTWREVLAATSTCTERHIAVQEYGRINHELLDGLRARGAEVTPVPVYQWMLPEDTQPLRAAARSLAAGEVDIALFTTSIQVTHLLQMAAAESVEPALRAALRSSTVVSSIGPTCTTALEEDGIPVDFAPSHPKMGFLVKETADRCGDLLASKRRSP